MQEQSVFRIIYLLCIGGLLLHLKTALIESSGPVDSFTLGLFSISIFPYLMILFLRKKYYGSLCAAIGVFVIDLFFHLDAFVFPSSSTAALGLLFIPFFNTLVVIPLSFLFSYFVKKDKSGKIDPLDQ